MQMIRGFAHSHQLLQQYARDERDEAVALLQEVRVAVLAFHNRAGTLLVNSASSFKASGASPLLPPTSGQHGRVVAKSCAPGPGARERTVARSGGAGVAAHDLRGAGAGGAGGRGRGPGADDQPSGRRTFPSVLNARSPGMKPPRNSRLFACRAYTGRAAPSVPGNDKPTGLGHAGLDAGGARLRRARLGLIWEGRPPELPCTKLSVEFPNFGTTASSRESVDAMDG